MMSMIAGISMDQSSVNTFRAYFFSCAKAVCLRKILSLRFVYLGSDSSAFELRVVLVDYYCFSLPSLDYPPPSKNLN